MITAVIMNYIETGLDRRKMVYITSNNNIEGIKNYLSHNETSFTSLDVRGGYTGDGREMLMAILDNQDYNHLLRGVHLVDPQAFMIAYDISEAHGGTFI